MILDLLAAIGPHKSIVGANIAAKGPNGRWGLKVVILLMTAHIWADNRIICAMLAANGTIFHSSKLFGMLVDEPLICVWCDTNMHCCAWRCALMCIICMCLSLRKWFDLFERMIDVGGNYWCVWDYLSWLILIDWIVWWKNDYYRCGINALLGLR